MYCRLSIKLNIMQSLHRLCQWCSAVFCQVAIAWCHSYAVLYFSGVIERRGGRDHIISSRTPCRASCMDSLHVQCNTYAYSGMHVQHRDDKYSKDSQHTIPLSSKYTQHHPLTHAAPVHTKRTTHRTQQAATTSDTQDTAQSARAADSGRREAVMRSPPPCLRPVRSS